MKNAIIPIAVALAAALRWGDWRNWQRYHSTMMFLIMGNLLYNFLYFGHRLWEYNPNHIITELLINFIVLPSTVLILLTNYPNTLRQKFVKALKYVTVYFLFELAYFYHGLISYHNGWNLWYSLLWLCMMFPILLLHHKKPLQAYAISILVFIVMMIYFPPNWT
ncbi:MAG: CBO0543 family protein [Deltaproteobacteria bacterium]